MKTVSRGGALALAAMAVLSTASLVAPARTGRAELAQASEILALPTAPPLRVERLAQVRARAAQPVFPVAGEFNWGQEGAGYGASRSGHMHEGQDVFARTGTPLVAVRDGVVVEQGSEGGRGNYVAVYDPRADRTHVYLHMIAPATAAIGERVRGGQELGGIGCTGSCYGDHLHFEIRAGRGTTGAPEDPLPALERWAAESGSAATLPPGAH